MTALHSGLPAVERDNIDEQWLRSTPPAIPEEVLQALSRTGHEVGNSGKFVPVRLRDGRQLIVPVDQVELALRRKWNILSGLRFVPSQTRVP